MRKVELKWNRFVLTLLALEVSWNGFQEAHGLLRGGESEKLSIEGQRICAMSTCRSGFLVALPRVLDHARRNGGLSTLLLKEEEKTDGAGTED